MDFSELLKESKALVFDLLRPGDDNYFEAVILNDGLPGLTVILEKYFGKAVFPSDAGLSKEIDKELNSLGGIMPGQTLYFLKQQGEVIFAMLWPWQDGKRITVKISKK